MMPITRYTKAQTVKVRMPDETDPNLSVWKTFTTVRNYQSVNAGQVSHVRFEHRCEENKRWCYFEDFVLGVRIVPDAEFK